MKSGSGKISSFLQTLKCRSNTTATELMYIWEDQKLIILFRSFFTKKLHYRGDIYDYPFLSIQRQILLTLNCRVIFSDNFVEFGVQILLFDFNHHPEKNLTGVITKLKLSTKFNEGGTLQVNKRIDFLII